MLDQLALLKTGTKADAGPRGARKASETRGLFRMGWGIIIFLFGGLMAWSVFAPFEGAVLASGSIAVESNQQAVQHLEGGIVGEIYVKEGDRVEVGQTLIALDETAAQARLSSIEARLFELLGREARLIAERDGSQNLKLRASMVDIAQTPRMQGIFISQTELMTARSVSRTTQVSLLNKTILQLRQRIQGATNEIAAIATQMDLIAGELEVQQGLMEKGLSTNARLLPLRRQSAQLVGQREALTSEIATTRIEISEAQIQLNQLTEGFRQELLTELQDVQTQASELVEQRVAALDQMKRQLILAPRSGRVIGVRTHTVGGVIAPRDPIMHVVPENDALIARVRFSPSDIDKVSPGNEAVLRFPAFSANATPEVFGIVVKVSADALQDNNTGQFYFEGILEIPADRLADQTFVLVPGMPVDASVKTESRTVISYLLKPLFDAMSRTFRE